MLILTRRVGETLMISKFLLHSIVFSLYSRSFNLSLHFFALLLSDRPPFFC